MNTVYVCRAKKCRAAYVVSALDPQAHLLKSSMKCPNHDICHGRIREMAKTNLPMENAKPIAAVDLYQATLGIGVAQERKCSPAEVKKALVGVRIVGIDTDPSPDPRRTIVYSLTLESGKVVHLASSTKGATIFKMTEVPRGR